mmetsp:Transcript_3429/g.12361  ORF Transcript_3429/g.12361 Transcript_3429/m.12361 type:complete len:152 (-) Transcript_3429:41-496(-)
MSRSIIRNVSPEKLQQVSWRLIDAKNQIVGKLASHISKLLQGKHKPTYTPRVEDGDVVVVINTDQVRFTGKKWDKKIYYRHTGYPGGLRERTAKEQHERDPTSVLRKAVERMLPKNNLQMHRMRKLRLFKGEEHQFPEVKFTPYVLPPQDQ